MKWLWCLLLVSGPAMADEAEFLKAAAEGNSRIVQAELAEGTPVDSHNSHGETALLLATQGNHIKAARLLIESGADVNARAGTGTEGTAYLHAGAMGYLEIITLLLDAGADPNIADADGITPLQHSERRGFDKISSILAQRNTK